MPYTEFNIVEKPIIEWLQELGWKYLPPEEVKRDLEDPFHLEVLEQSIRRLNPDLVTDDVDKVVGQLRKISNDLSGNKEFFEWLKGERSVVLKPGEKAKTIRLLDFDNPENNNYVVTNQFKFVGYENVKLDIALIVNGIPLVVIEAKVPTRELLDYNEAIRQIKRYARDAPQFLKYLAYVCPTDGVIFKYGWVTQEQEKFFEWKNGKPSDPVEVSVKGLFEKNCFLDMVCNFVVFEKELKGLVKKVAMQQQVIAANKIVERVLDGKLRSGLIWHTQGSGKTLTMLFAAWKLKRLTQLENPTIIVVVDRIELETQLGTTFENVDLPYTDRAKSIGDLISKIKRDTRDVLITTVQKFQGIEEALSKRENIIVFIDEAHRTQYGELGISMRNALPNAIIFGLTGTPIEKGPLGKSTFRTFCPAGETYLDRYSVKQSIEDGTTVPLLYVSRPIEYRLPSRMLDEEFFAKTRGLNEEQQEKVLQTSARLKEALKSKDRIEKISKDMAEHFLTHVEPDGLKAQLVAVDREACALYKEALDKCLPPGYSEVIYTANPNDDALLRKYHMDRVDQLKIAKDTFQRPKVNPRIIIVTDMLLTGFDAPIEQVMYLDKPLRDHKLLQAIARTNRPYEGKEAGIIVDYVGIFEKLQKALNFEEKDIRGVAYRFDQFQREFTKTVSVLSGIFMRVKRDDSRESLFKALNILEDEKQLKMFKEQLSRLRRLYETIAPDPFLQQYKNEYGWLIAVNEAYNKLERRGSGDLSEYQEKTRQLIKEKLLINRIEVILPTFKVDKHYLKLLDAEKFTREQRIMDMKRALSHHIRINLEANPIYETLSQRLERILKSKNKAQIEAELQTLVKEVAQIEEETKRMGISHEEYAYINTLKKHESRLAENELVAFSKDLSKEVKTKTFPMWQKNPRAVKEVEQTVFDVCFKRYSDTMDIRKLSSLTEELVRFVAKYNA